GCCSKRLACRDSSRSASQRPSNQHLPDVPSGFERVRFTAIRARRHPTSGVLLWSTFSPRDTATRYSLWAPPFRVQPLSTESISCSRWLLKLLYLGTRL
ncbi:hypothetical protein PENTCL1PPCAC_19999, partial [Pristionchus entomophagus]